ncbi:methenyltetrahydromethanopterin cyclohydrolase [Rubrivivax gelatinosus]|uniref:methenyltetrahydromethanopterin cyclohydrolase n=1 Tax=Rubrivivax gelatinosus TaxID=28068 RepID=UPI0019070D7B|nr:methenyltetrahydromethanopterin cyclohydrolase [Rubrivivax gelatinosus]MBK1612317.1 methenyltetrahydromethanopterin cyclohydrolase [Rubrivivax gelatinosus]
MSTTSPLPLAGCTIALNEHVAEAVERLCADAATLGLKISTLDGGVRLVDAGIEAPGSVAAGLRIAEICMGGLGEATLVPGSDWPTQVQVRSSMPVLACLGSQYAGWSLAASKEETGGKKFFALGSGPARALAAKEPLYAELGWRDQGARGVLVLEVDRPPPAVVVDKILRDCALAPEALTIVLTPTRSAAGTTQVVARVLEVALHKAHELHFALADIVDGVGWAPLPAPHPDAVEAMGRTNDAILYGGRVQLSVRGSDDAARLLALALPSRGSRDYGKSFAETFREAGFDFYKIDPALFAPAEVWVSNLDSGRSWHAGATNPGLLETLWLEARA